MERAWDDGITVVTAAGNLGPARAVLRRRGSRKVITVGQRSAGAKRNPDAARHGTASANRILSRLENVHFLRAWKKQEGICGEGGLDGGTAGVGAVALALERVPDLTNVQAKMLLCESARDLGLPRNRQGMGCFKQTVFCLFCETCGKT